MIAGLLRVGAAGDLELDGFVSSAVGIDPKPGGA